MPVIWTTPEAFPALLRRHLELDASAAAQAALEVATRGEAFAVLLTDALDKVDTGLFRQAWQSGPIPGGAELGNDAPYSDVIEWGRRPMRAGPPFQPIYEWVVRKLVANGAVKPEDAEMAAYAIREAIHRRGLPPYNILGTTHQKMRGWFKEAAMRFILQRGL